MKPLGIFCAWAMAAGAALAADSAFTGAYRGADPGLLSEVRTAFAAAPDSASAAQALAARLDAGLPADRAAWPPVFLAYRAALEGLAGKHSSTPWEKYRRAKAGLAMFQGLAEAHPESVEIRMLRYSAGSQLPEFFGAQAQAEEDLRILAEGLVRGADPLVPAELRNGYIRWILDNGRPAPEIRARLEAALGAAD